MNSSLEQTETFDSGIVFTVSVGYVQISNEFDEFCVNKHWGSIPSSPQVEDGTTSGGMTYDPDTYDLGFKITSVAGYGGYDGPTMDVFESGIELETL